MAGSTLKSSDIILALKKAKLSLNAETSDLNVTNDCITFINRTTKTKINGKVVRSLHDCEVCHWPSLKHENIAILMDIVRIRDNLFIYLSLHGDVTLRNMVHDEIFFNDTKCFDRKRSYAKGIFSGLAYLHGKSLVLMNLCDDNIIISGVDDKAIITNFDRLSDQPKATILKLNVPDMYRAPETENGEFDAIKAELWASGVLMLDMFLAHMVPWAVVNYNRKEVNRVVDSINLELFQSTNAGLVVSALDLAKFQTFVKCLLRQNPMERMQARYASIASFLQYRDKYKKNRKF